MKAKNETMEIWAIDRLIPYDRNPRKNDAVVDKMAASIKEFGFKIPVLARSDGTVIDGHLRLKAAHKLKIKEVPVILCDEWTDAQIKAFRIIANKSVAWAEWDDELLALEFADLKELDFDLSLTGFEFEEIDKLLDSSAPDLDLQEEELVPNAPSNILVKLSFPSSVWIGKRDEIMKVFSRMEKNYLCTVKVDE
jgi:ParB-like chromosome segregation protein Spo0J